MKVLKKIVPLVLIGSAAGAFGFSAYKSHQIEKEFPIQKSFYSKINLKEIKDGEELVILRNPASDLHIKLRGSGKPWKKSSLRLRITTESKEIGNQSFEWLYFGQSLRLEAKRLDPDSFVKITFHSEQPEPIQLSKFEVRTNHGHPKVLIFGFDGAGFNLLKPLMDSGRCPNFKKLLEEGSHGDLVSEEPAYSPVVWTTVASGRTPDDHGITFFLARSNPETSEAIKVKRFWDIFTQHSSLNSMILGWYLTWPVEDLQGGLISDRAYYRFKTKDLSFPSGIFETEFEKIFTDISHATDKDLSRFTSFRYYWDWRKRFARQSKEYVNSGLVHQRLAHVYRRDSAYAQMGLKLMNTMHPDILALYLRGVDFTSHAFWKFRYSDQVPFFPVTTEERLWFHDVIDHYYIYLDEILGDYVALADQDTTIFVMSDHGFRAITKEEAGGPEISGAHHLNGILFCKGPLFKKRYRIPKASIYDFLPTLLYISGLPQASDMPGRVLTDAILPDYVAKNPVKKIKTYGGRKSIHGESTESADEEIKEELRSLGYIQ